MDSKELHSRFTYHKPKNDGVIMKHQRIRAAGDSIANLINETVPEGREKSLAITKLEEAVMWANAGIARDSNNAQ